MSTVAPVRAANFGDLRQQLKDATDEQVAATAAHWAALTGQIAANARHLVDEEFEVRQAVARLTHITTGGDR